MILLTGRDLTPENVGRIARGELKVEIAQSALRRMEESHALVREIQESGKPTYGISTGFGELSRISITGDMNRELQQNLIRSHASGVGKSLDKAAVRALMVLRLNALCVGFSGVNPEVTKLLQEFINQGIILGRPYQEFSVQKRPVHHVL